MKELRIEPLFSGSGGNCTYIEGGGAKILIDAGVSARRICRALPLVGADISQIDAIFITHEHTDHTSALNVLTGRCPIPVHMTQASYAASGLSCPVVTHRRFIR